MAWQQDDAKALAAAIGYHVIPYMVGVDGLREILRNAYQQRADLNHKIQRAEAALRDMVQRPQQSEVIE